MSGPDLSFFAFYPRDFQSHDLVQEMSFEERGVFVWLLCTSWQRDGLPTDTQRLANICGMQHRRFLRVWKTVGQCFHNDGERLRNPRQEIERKRAFDKYDRARIAGKLGAKHRWRDKTTHGNPNGKPIAKGMATQNSDSSSKEEEGEPATTRCGKCGAEYLTTKRACPHCDTPNLKVTA